MATYYGITDLTGSEIKTIKEAKQGRLNYVVGPMISKRAHIGWTTNGHTGEDVVLYVYSPTGDRPTGVIENTDIAKYMERMLGLNLQETTKKLFVPARIAFESKGAKVEWDDSEPNNPVVIVTRGNDKLRLPVNKNLAEINGKLIKMNGLTVYNGVFTFVPQIGRAHV